MTMQLVYFLYQSSGRVQGIALFTFLGYWCNQSRRHGLELFKTFVTTSACRERRHVMHQW